MRGWKPRQAGLVLLTGLVLVLAGCGGSSGPAPAVSCSPASGATPVGRPCSAAVDPAGVFPSDPQVQRQPPAPGAIARFTPRYDKARSRLNRLTPGQRTRLSAVRAALIAAGLPAAGVDVSPTGPNSSLPPGSSVTEVYFGARTSMSKNGLSACVFGVTTRSQVIVHLGGTIKGSCLIGPVDH
jgi:hypothetical protein